VDVLGIDQGIAMLMVENYRSGFVWEYFMKAREAQRAMKLAGFSSSLPTPEGQASTSAADKH
jgi:hypothetical protein